MNQHWTNFIFKIVCGIKDLRHQYNSERQFLDSEAETIRVVFADLIAGKYAFAVFQDKNLNENSTPMFLEYQKKDMVFQVSKYSDNQTLRKHL